MKQMVKHAIVGINTMNKYIQQTQCLTDKIVYKAEVETKDDINELSTKVYFGISEIKFKSRFNNHTMSFRKSNIRK